MVFPEALLGRPDSPDQPTLEIGRSSRKVQPLLRDRVVEHGVDREVAPDGILLRILGVGHLVRPAAIAVAALAAKRRHFRESVVATDLHHAEALAHATRPLEQLHDLLGPRVSRHVAVLDRTPEQLVAHAAAHPIGLVAVGLEPLDDLQRHVSATPSPARRGYSFGR